MTQDPSKHPSTTSNEFQELIEPYRAHMRRLEATSIFLLREAFASFPELCMLWSVGKDSTVLLWLARKAFLNDIPFPLIHIDTSYKIKEMISFRNEMARIWGFQLLVAQNEQALAAKTTFPDSAVDRTTCCSLLKTKPLTEVLEGQRPLSEYLPSEDRFALMSEAKKYRAVIVGLRADEEGSRSKERYFSPRNVENRWEIKEQPPEFWNAYATTLAPGASVRVHPLLDWSELDIWRYICLEEIPVVPLYFANAEQKRYRSLGCAPCTAMIDSPASTPLEIVRELSTGDLQGVPERSGRAQDKEGGGTLEVLRRDGYM